MRKIRVTYRNCVTKTTALNRIANDLKNLYWQVGDEPKDWYDFDGDIEISASQPRNGDCLEVVFHEKMRSGWVTSIISDLAKHKDVSIIEEWKKNEHGEICFVQI